LLFNSKEWVKSMVSTLTKNWKGNFTGQQRSYEFLSLELVVSLLPTLLVD
ncbi:hypothetical protein MKW98_000750, partial [Papaver atlanticum]